MRTTVVQSVEISTLKTSASLPNQIRIRRSTSGQAVRLRNAIASPNQTSAVDRRCWKGWAKYVTHAPMVIVITSTSIERSQQIALRAVPSQPGEPIVSAILPKSPGEAVGHEYRRDP